MSFTKQGAFRTRWTRLAACSSLIAALAACNGARTSAAPTATSPPDQTGGLDVQIVGTDFAVGNNRFTFTVSHGSQPLTTGRPVVYFFSLHGFNALPAGRETATFVPLGAGQSGSSGGFHGVYVTHTSFDRAGKWGAEIVVPEGGKKRSLQTIFTVTRHAATPSVGQTAPLSANPTSPQTPIAQLDSGKPPDDMHRVSIRSAITRHRPLLVLFASWAYCGAFHCGAEIAEVQRLESRYRSVAFVHVDVFRHARPPQLSSTARQWHIPSQPWVFVVNRRGLIVAKFEGPAAASEIAPFLHEGAR